jgi:dTDP-glucose 4,6-dehydratase
VRALVSGGAGFIGSHLCAALVGRGDQVVCVDDLSSGEADNVRELADDPAFEMVVADVTKGVDLDGRFDAVLHFASPASPVDYMKRPLETLAAGSEGTRVLLELAGRDSARFVLASTSEVYGDPEVHPQPESYRGSVSPVGPRSVYDEAKRFAEALTMAWVRTNSLDGGILRIFNTYGPRLRPRDGRVVSNFVEQALEGSPLTIHGEGTQTRSLCYVDDLVAGVLKFLDSALTGPLNLGNPEEISVIELARLVIEITGSSSDITFLPLPEDDPVRRKPDITRARELLDWEPSVHVRDGLARLAEYMREQLQSKPEASRSGTR